MPAIKIEQVGGQLPAWDDHLLPAGQAAAALNLYPFSGRMEGWRKPKLLRQLTNSAAKYAYRVPATSGAAATAYLIYTGAVTVNDTITIGEFTYRINFGLSNQNDVDGATNSAPQFVFTNLLAALSLDKGLGTNAGTLYNKNTMANPDVGFAGVGTTSEVVFGPWGVALQVVYPVLGAAGNGVPVSASSANAKWVSDPVSMQATTVLTGGQNVALANNSITSQSSWIELTDPDSTVVRSQVLNDAFNRFYISSPSVPPMYNTAQRIGQGLPAWKLGIEPPTVGPTIVTSGGGNNIILPSGTSPSGTTAAGGPGLYLKPIFTHGEGAIQTIQFVPVVDDANIQFAAVIYADAGTGTQQTGFSVPGALLGVGTIVTGYSNGSVATSQFQNPVALQKGLFYWIGIIASNTSTYQSDGNAITFRTGVVFANGPPGTIGAGTATTPNLYLWANIKSDDVFESRSYVYTWITAYGEESAPSPFTNTDGWTDGTWTLTFPAPTSADVGTLRNLVTTRIYRTITAANGSTSFFWVTDIPITQTTYADNATDAVIALNITLPSTNYFPPQPNLQGLVVMANGMMAAFTGTQVWICQPYLPHAWPPANVFNVDFPIVGLGFTNGALVVCTQGNPYVISGANPSVMSVTKCQLTAPCLSRASILSTDLGVYYMALNGLIQVTNLGQATDVTELWITREKWAQLVPTTLGAPRAAQVATTYFCYGTDPTKTGALPAGNTPPAANGFALELQTDNTSFTIWPQPGGHRVGFTPMSPPNGFYVDNLLVDPWTGVALVVQNGAIYYYDFTDTAAAMQPFRYMSKIFQQNNKKNFSAMRVFFSIPATTPTQNAVPSTKEFSDPSWNNLQPGQYAIVRVYADLGNGMQLVTAREVRSSGGLLRIAGGFKAEQWQVDVLSQVPISNIQLATSVKELGNV